jgi:hypothetical protein
MQGGIYNLSLRLLRLGIEVKILSGMVKWNTTPICFKIDNLTYRLFKVSIGDSNQKDCRSLFGYIGSKYVEPFNRRHQN